MIEMLLDEERKIFKRTVRKFAEKEVAPHVKKWEEEGQYPEEYYSKLAHMGFLGLLVPEEYGGSGGSMIDLVILCEELGRVGVSFPLTHVSACCRSIVNQGSEDQKGRYLPALASGKRSALIVKPSLTLDQTQAPCPPLPKRKMDTTSSMARRYSYPMGKSQASLSS